MKDAETAYADRHQECCILVEKITAALGDMDATSGLNRKHGSDWGRVGDLLLVRRMLTDAAEVLGVEL